MKNLNLDSYAVQEMTQGEINLIDGGNIFKDAWGGIKAAGEWVGNAAEDTWNWVEGAAGWVAQGVENAFDAGHTILK